MARTSRGFTLMELIVCIAIVLVLLFVAANALGTSKSKKEVSLAADTIAATLEKAKANAMAGKNGQNFGVKFDSDSYVYFPGSSYIASNENNVRSTLGNTLSLSNTISNSDDIIVFSRITGEANTTATVTVSLISNSSIRKNVVIGSFGDISVVE